MAKQNRYGPQAEALYIQGQSPEEIAKTLPVSAKTIRAWADYHGWAKRRALKLASGRQLADQLEEVLQRKLADLQANPALATPGELDGIHKMFGIVERVRRGTFALSSAALEVMDLFSRYLRQAERDPAYLDRTGDHVKAFLAQVGK